MFGNVLPIASLISVLCILSAIGNIALLGGSVALSVLLVLIGLVLPMSLKQANQWERAVILRLGRYVGLRGPGIFFIIPFFDTIADCIDQRIQTTEIKAEKALTKDTVSVNVDAIVIWQVHDVEKAALEIADYESAVIRVAQTTLRETIGASDLTTLLSDRKKADEVLKEAISTKTSEWGIDVTGVEIKDVAIPTELENAMSRQAQAEREKQARVTLASAEKEVADKMAEAAAVYDSSPAAMRLRQMNLAYELGKSSNTIIIPTEMAGSLGGMVGAAALLESGKAKAKADA